MPENISIWKLKEKLLNWLVCKLYISHYNSLKFYKVLHYLHLNKNSVSFANMQKSINKCSIPITQFTFIRFFDTLFFFTSLSLKKLPQNTTTKYSKKIKIKNRLNTTKRYKMNSNDDKIYIYISNLISF